jgi:hypothetical protein
MSEAQKRQISMTKGGWSDEELALLDYHFTHSLPAELRAALPLRSRDAILSKAHRRGLKRPLSLLQAKERNPNWKGGLPYKDKRTWAERLAQDPEGMRARMRVHSKKRRALALGSVRGVSYDAILLRDGYRCWLCGESVDHADLSFDHVIPLSKGGPHEEDNIRVVHLACNHRKGVRVVEALAFAPEQSHAGITIPGLGPARGLTAS